MVYTISIDKNNYISFLFFLMSSSSISYFHRFWVINSVIAGIFWWFFIFLVGFTWSTQYWDIFYSGMILFSIFSFVFYYWKSWGYSISEPSFSSLKAWLRISIAWMLVWDIFILWEILIQYFKNPNRCFAFWGDSPCSFWERLTHDFGTFILILFMVFLFVLPILFSITGLYLDKRKNKKSFPWMGIVIFIGIIIFLFWSNIYL